MRPRVPACERWAWNGEVCALDGAEWMELNGVLEGMSNFGWMPLVMGAGERLGDAALISISGICGAVGGSWCGVMGFVSV